MENAEEIDARLASIEARLAALEAATRSDHSGQSGQAGSSDQAGQTRRSDQSAGAMDQRFWVLNGLREQLSGNGGVVFAGSVQVADGPVEWQLGQTTDALLETDWAALAPEIAALGHPVRLSLLQAILSGSRTVAELSEHPGMGSTGQLYHHLNQLSAHGWLKSLARGRYAVPAARVVPLMVILTAAGRVA